MPRPTLSFTSDPSSAGGAVEACAAEARPVLAAKRSRLAYASLADCHLCAHHCGVNRLTRARGRCHASAEARFFSAQLEMGDELELLPTFAVATSGCDLRCDFCITGAESWNPRAGAALLPAELAANARRALANGARTVQFLGGEPTIHLPAILGVVAELPASAKLVWKTNAHGSAQARVLLEGIFDIWVADFKFGNDACARRLAGIERYTEIVRENLYWAAEHTELLVRHLLMPGHVECCWRPIARWLAAELPLVKVSLRAGFWPAWRSARHTELLRAVHENEWRAAVQIATDSGLYLSE